MNDVIYRSTFEKIKEDLDEIVRKHNPNVTVEKADVEEADVFRIRLGSSHYSLRFKMNMSDQGVITGHLDYALLGSTLNIFTTYTNNEPSFSFYTRGKRHFSEEDMYQKAVELIGEVLPKIEESAKKLKDFFSK